jgi:hypothetical protein
MKMARVLTIIYFLLMTFAFSACRNDTAENQKSSIAASQPPKTFSKIEEIDFKNFTYPYPYASTGADQRVLNLTLSNGEKSDGGVEDISFKLIKIDHIDLTNDGNNEAVINIKVCLAVSETNWIYVYTLKGEPQLLKVLAVGEDDKGYTRLKNFYSENGELIIDLFGKNEFENGEWKFDSCCPKNYTQTRFKWDGNKFAVVSSKVVSLKEDPRKKAYHSIRKIDFRNFAYVYPSDSSETFALVDGKKEQTENEDGASLGKIEYGDVTSDGKEEAFLRIQPITGGNCQCEMVFVYTLENGKPELLWSFETEDRAAGGLKRIYAENGKLIVETFGDTKFENDKWNFRMPEGRAGGLCCPTAYTKIRFEWNGEKFASISDREIYDYDWRQQSKS